MENGADSEGPTVATFALNYPSLDAARFEVERRLKRTFHLRASSFRDDYWLYECRDFKHTIEIFPNHDYDCDSNAAFIHHATHAEFPVIIEVTGSPLEVGQVVNAFNNWPELIKLAGLHKG